MLHPRKIPDTVWFVCLQLWGCRLVELDADPAAADGRDDQSDDANGRDDQTYEGTDPGGYRKAYQHYNDCTYDAHLQLRAFNFEIPAEKPVGNNLFRFRKRQGISI